MKKLKFFGRNKKKATAVVTETPSTSATNEPLIFRVPSFFSNKLEPNPQQDLAPALYTTPDGIAIRYEPSSQKILDTIMDASLHKDLRLMLICMDSLKIIAQETFKKGPVGPR